MFLRKQRLDSVTMSWRGQMSTFLHTGSNFRRGAASFDVAFLRVFRLITCVFLEGGRICVEHFMRETLFLNNPGVDGAALGGLLNLCLCWTLFSVEVWWLPSAWDLQNMIKWRSLNILAYNFHANSCTTFTIPCKKVSATDAGALKIASSSVFCFSPSCFLAVLCSALGNVWLKKKRLYCSRNWDVVQCWLLYLYSNDLVFWRFSSVVN